MESPIYVSLSRQNALRRQMDVIANNIANANTTGFKRQGMLFNEFLERPSLHEKVSFVQDRAVVRDTRLGQTVQTNNSLDFALTGEGYFTVDTASGRRYTRAGNFKLNDRREIVDTNGLPVLDDRGRSMVVPDNAREIRVTADGTLSTEQGQVGKFNLVTFPNEQMMTEVGGGLYVSDERAEAAPEGTTVAQGMLEQSNVNTIVETTSMIEVLRQYQTNQKLIEAESERIRAVMKRLAKPLS